MADVDNTLALHAPGGPQGASLTPSGPANAFGAMAPMAQFAQAMNQLKLFQANWAARQQMGQIIAGAPDLESGLAAASRDPSVAAFAGEQLGQWRQLQQMMVQTQGAQATQARDAVSAAVKSAAVAMRDPSQFESMLATSIQGLPPEVQARALPYLQSYRQTMEDGLPGDKTKWAPADTAKFQSRVMGSLVGMGVPMDALAGMMGWMPRHVETNLPLPSGATGAAIVGGPELGGTGGGNPPNAGGFMGGSTAGTDGGAGGIGGGNALAPRPAPAPATATPGAGFQLLTSGPSKTQGEYMTSRGKQGADYQQNLDDDVKTQGMIMQTLAQARDAAENFKPGGGASVYARIGQFAQALGASQQLVDKISNGNLGASQEFQKLMVNTTMGQIRAQLSGMHGSRLSQQEFETFQRNNPNIDTDPRAIEKIFNFWTKVYSINHAEQTELNRFVGQGGNISEWPTRWQDIAQQRGYITPEITNKTNSGAKPDMIWNPQTRKLEPAK